jgi:hypothetical protein
MMMAFGRHVIARQKANRQSHFLFHIVTAIVFGKDKSGKSTYDEAYKSAQWGRNFQIVPLPEPISIALLCFEYSNPKRQKI